jgi:hypothetical protein
VALSGALSGAGEGGKKGGEEEKTHVSYKLYVREIFWDWKGDDRRPSIQSARYANRSGKEKEQEGRHTPNSRVVMTPFLFWGKWAGNNNFETWKHRSAPPGRQR